MFKWYRKRKELKKIKKLKESLNEGINALGEVRDRTIIGDLANKGASSQSVDISTVNITSVVIAILAIIDEIDKEVDDRTRPREFIFPKDKKTNK